MYDEAGVGKEVLKEVTRGPAGVPEAGTGILGDDVFRLLFERSADPAIILCGEASRTVMSRP
jgi:hypothetical protein